MTEVFYKNAAKDLTIETVLEMYELGMVTVVNDGRDVTVTIDPKE